jgi:hypothetical protein
MPTTKPDFDDLKVDVAAQTWHRSGTDDGCVEVAFTEALGARWALVRVAGDLSGRVLVYDKHEWDCFLDGVRKGEFEDAAPEHG